MATRLLRSGQVLLFAGIAAVLTVAVALSLSDRVPDLAERGAEALGVDRAVKDLSPAHDPWLVVHATGWMLVSFSVGLPFARWTRRAAASAAALTLSVGLELAQEVVTSAHHFEAVDLVANSVGITLGFGACGLWWRMRRAPSG